MKRLRWKKNKRPTGLAGVVCGNPGHTLKYGDEDVATAYEHNWRGNVKGWYWVVRYDPLIPLKILVMKLHKLNKKQRTPR